MAGGDSVDGTALRFLVKKALRGRRRRGGRRRRRGGSRRLRCTHPKRRKKKRRKKKLPKSGCRPGCGSPVIMPQIQFIHRRLVFQLWRRDKYPQCMFYSSRCSSWTRFLTCPLWCFDKCLVQKTVVLPQLQSIVSRRHSLSFHKGSSSWSSLFSRPQRFPCCCSISGGRCPCYVGRAISPVQVVERTVIIPQSQLVEKIVVALEVLALFVDMPVVCNNRCFGSRSAENCGFAVAVHHGRRHSLRGTDAVHGPCDHGDSPVVCGQGGRCPWYAGRAVQVFFYSPLYLAVTCTVFGVRL